MNRKRLEKIEQKLGEGLQSVGIIFAKGRDPRQIELKILKNRNGRSGDTIAYDYYPAFFIRHHEAEDS